MEGIKLGKECHNIGCIHNTGIFFYNTRHENPAKAEFKCELENPRITTDSEGLLCCEDEIRYESIGGV